MTPADRAEVEKIVKWGSTPWATFIFIIVMCSILAFRISQEATRISALEAQVQELRKEGSNYREHRGRAH